MACQRWFLGVGMFAALLTLLAASVHAAQTKGFGMVQVTTQAGRQVELYRGSHALLIGVSDYTAGWPDLEAIPAELDRLQAALERQGFSVTRVRNPDNRQMKRAFEDFIGQYGYDGQNRLLFYYSGHGYTRSPGGRQPTGMMVIFPIQEFRRKPKAVRRKVIERIATRERQRLL